MLDQRVVLVGQAPNREAGVLRRQGEALTGRAGDRIAALAGLTRLQYLRRTERVNLLRRWPGRAGKGDRFPTGQAAMAAARLRPKLSGRVVIAVGLAVARALAGRVVGGPVTPLVWILVERGRRPHGGFVMGVLPHPSGVNRWWNERRNVAAAMVFLRRVLGAPQAAGGSGLDVPGPTRVGFL